MNGHTDVVEFLLTFDDINLLSGDSDSLTPLWHASQDGNHTIVKLLLDHKDSKAYTQEELQQNLDTATRNGHLLASNEIFKFSEPLNNNSKLLSLKEGFLKLLTDFNPLKLNFDNAAKNFTQAIKEIRNFSYKDATEAKILKQFEQTLKTFKSAVAEVENYYNNPFTSNSDPFGNHDFYIQLHAKQGKEFSESNSKLTEATQKYDAIIADLKQYKVTAEIIFAESANNNSYLSLPPKPIMLTILDYSIDIPTPSDTFFTEYNKVEVAGAAPDLTTDHSAS